MLTFLVIGGYVSDVAYKKTRSVWAKKVVLHVYSLMTGVFLILIGIINSKDQSTMFGLVAGLAFFLEGGNGAGFGLVWFSKQNMGIGHLLTILL